MPQLFGPPDKVSVGFYRAAVTDLSPGLQPWVRQPRIRPERAAESSSVVAPPLGNCANGRLFMKADRRFNAVCIGRPFSFQGGFAGRIDPGLKPWAKICSRFAAKSDTLLVDRKSVV